eukprot:1372448-Pleurochrysis_carterae.AAC.1
MQGAKDTALDRVCAWDDCGACSDQEQEQKGWLCCPHWRWIATRGRRGAGTGGARERRETLPCTIATHPGKRRGAKR